MLSGEDVRRGCRLVIFRSEPNVRKCRLACRHTSERAQRAEVSSVVSVFYLSVTVCFPYSNEKQQTVNAYFSAEGGDGNTIHLPLLPRNPL